MTPGARTVHRSCNLCEASCGLTIEVVDDVVTSIRGDEEDPFSRGYVCPKGIALQDLQSDPDRLRRPLLKRDDGTFEEIGWDDALDLVADRLCAIRDRDGGDAVALYLGNPITHGWAPITFIPLLIDALGTHQRYSAASVDQQPQHLLSYLLFGSPLLLPVPDVDRTDFLLVLGGNPLVSNGSIMTAPDMRGRLAALRKRGGRLVVVDPRRSETADVADEHVFVRPGTDVWLLAVIGAALAPTDAALGVSIIENPRIPLRLREVINVESGLNDGLVTPVVSFCIAIAAATLDGLKDRPFVSALVEVVIGVAVGFVIGEVSGRLLEMARRQGWAVPLLVPVAPVVVAVATYVFVVLIGGNGFVAAFVCGVGFGSATRRSAQASTAERADDVDLLGFSHGAAALLGYAVWFIFGESVLGSLTTTHLGTAVVYAVLSLTALRMLPVALSAVGLHLPWDTVLLVGWLGPRGLASIIFGILAADVIGGAAGELVLTVVATTVAMSVLAHGLSAGPLAAWYSGRHPVDEQPGSASADTG